MGCREIMRRICAIFAIIAVAAYFPGNGVCVEANTVVTGGVFLTETVTGNDDHKIKNEKGGSTGSQEEKTGNTGKEKDYIVRTKTKEGLSKIKKKYSVSDEINDNREDHLGDNKTVSVKLSGEQAELLSDNDDVKFIEEDKFVTASSHSSKGKAEFKKGNQYIKDKKVHKKKVKHYKKNTSSTEWNVRMINAKKKAGKAPHRIKVAILDSGIDWGNDIDLAYQISLVPGEEEMTQVFMDGNGHGSSVASLIAANDDGKGITGINSNIDIYSYRVLGEENKAPVSRVAEAIYMAMDQEVNIINMSFGLNDYSEALEEAIHAAKTKGILVIAAAGNTGDRGVQYPAAYEEVMAVGAVNQYGSVEDYSAKGEEVEIVAPGERVRTTGFIGTEEVTSGTSLAAAQVTAVAALIWQKDRKVSADFVRGLLNESANLYGQTDEYGNGLVDAEYALRHYDEYKSKYKENMKEDSGKAKQLIPENLSEIETFEDTGCVGGSWLGDDHAGMIDSAKFCVRAGARFPDLKGDKKFTYGGKSYTYYMGKDLSDSGGSDTRKFAGMTVNPWWHGYYTTNYIKAAIYATRIADAIGTYGNQYQADNSFGYDDAFAMQSSIEDLYAKDQTGWKYAVSFTRNMGGASAQNQNNTNGFKRALLWGMAIHTATDAYAHSAEDRRGRIKHEGNYYDADNRNYISGRYYDASAVARQMLGRYNNKQALVARDLVMPANYTVGYKLMNYSVYISQVDPSITGYRYTFNTK